jgi:hypothetical protein
LSQLAVEGDDSSYHAYTKLWLRTVDRGGLFSINDAGFFFFRAIELITQVHLPNHPKSPGNSSKEGLLRQISEDDDVTFYW